jgi:transcriptional regulator with XRE-family HTH domain
MGRLKYILIYLKGRQRKLDKKKIIGANVIKFRKLRGFEQIQLAEKARLSEESISNVERGTSNATIDTLTKIADALKIDIEELFLERALTLNLALSEKNINNIEEIIKFLQGVLKKESK